MKTPTAGTILISDPFLKDPNFQRTVVFLCDHREEGSFGFVINRRFDQTLDQLIPDLEGHAVPVYYGGPVQTDTLHFIHTMPEVITGGQEINDDVYWGGNFEIVLNLIRDRALDLNRIRFFLGYSGWGDGQLKDELKEKSWLTTHGSQRLVFYTDPDVAWKTAVLSLGNEYREVINYPLDPQLN